MNIETLLRKLKPLLPGEVAHWTSVRKYADSELQQLLDRHIHAVAQKHLGDYDDKLLLSLPLVHKAKGAFNLGTILYEKEKWPLGVSAKELMNNLLIFGRSGSGKTNVAFHLLRQLTAKNIPFLFLDWKRTARHLIPLIPNKLQVYTPGRGLSPFPFNPFVVPPGLENNVYINHVIDVLSHAYTLGDGARSVLQKSISACYQKGNHTPNVNDVIKEVEATPSNERSRAWKISTIRALESLAFSEITSSRKLSQAELVKQLLHSNTVVELDGLSHTSKKFLIPMLCLWIYYVQLGSPDREKLNLVIFIEEAHHVLYRQEQRWKESTMNMLLRQCRELGVGMVVVDQHPHLISSAALGNCFTSICLNQKDPSDINKATALSGMDDSDKRHLTMLPVGQGVVKMQDRWRHPVLVKFPLINIEKGFVSDDLLKRYVGVEGKKNLLKIGRMSDEIARVPRVPLLDYSLNEGELAFLQDVVENLDCGVKERFARLDFSIGRGSRLKQRLLLSGWLEEATVKQDRTRKQLLRLSHTASKHLFPKPRTLYHGSLIHEYWKRYYAQFFQDLGYVVTMEAPRKGGRVDVLACKDDERIGIEIETGKSDFVSNVKNCLRSKFDKVVVVATDKTAMKEVERELAKVGLLISQRAMVVLQHNLRHVFSGLGDF